MVDIKCSECRKKFGFLYLGQETHPCNRCGAINDLVEIRQAFESVAEDLKKAKEHGLTDITFKKKP